MPNVTMIGGDGRVTVPFSSEAAASIAGGIENTLLGLVNRGTIVVQDFSGTGVPTLPSGRLSAVLIRSDGYSQFDRHNVPFIQVDSTGTTNISNHSTVQTVIAGGGGTLLYTAINTDSVAGPSAVVWASGGINAVRATQGATADFNFDGGVSLVDASYGVTTTSLVSGLAAIHGANDAFAAGGTGTPTVLATTGSTMVEVGGSELAAAAFFLVGSAGGTVLMRGNAALVVQDPFAGRVAVTRTGVPVAEGQVAATVTGVGNFLDGGGGSPTVTVDNGSLYLSNTVTDMTVINPAGNATICGGVPGIDGLGHFAWRPGTGTGSLLVLPSDGSVTLFGGHTGGLVYGGHAGHNLLVAGDFSLPAGTGPSATPAVTSTLVGGGSGDTLIAGPGGADALVASYGNTTLIGTGSGLGNLFVLGRALDPLQAGDVGADQVIGNNGSNTFVLGSGDATIAGGHGTGQTGSDIYVDFGNQAVAPHATVEITDFRLGTDILELAGTGRAADLSVLTVSRGHGNTTVVLSDGLNVTFDHVANAPVSSLVVR